MNRFKCWNNAGMFSGASDSAGKCILNLLKAFNFRERKSVIKIITIVKTREEAIVAEVAMSRV